MAAAAGLGASWLLDAIKPSVSMSSQSKVLLFFALDSGFLGLLYGLNDHWWRISVVLSSVFLSLAAGKMAHSVTSLLQALKDKNRVSVMVSRRQAPR
jgi:hypothetical protein